MKSIEFLIRDYQRIVGLNPKDAKAHHHLAMYYFQQSDYAKALEHFLAALQAEPSFLLAHYHAGVLYFKQNNFAMAKLRFLSVLDLDCHHIAAHFYLGVIFLQEKEFAQAELHFQAILSREPNHISTLVNLGALALKREAGQTAINYFTQALILDNHHAEARRNLAATFLHYDRFENALTHYVELQKDHALEIDDYYNMGVASMVLGYLAEAEKYYQQVLQKIPNHPATLSNLAAIYIRQGKRDDAIPLLKLALKNNYTDASSEFMLNVLEKKHNQLKVSHDYIKNLFNNYAVNFDSHLQKMLCYSLPQQSFDILRAIYRDNFKHLLDLGCGTGLSGVVWREYCEHLTGVDLSEKMLAQARAKNCYDHLVESDIVSFLKNNQQDYDFIQALDVLPYFDELDELFSVMIQRLATSGILVFSAEVSATQNWAIQDSMRFCHSQNYIHGLLSKYPLQLLHSEQVIARKENEQNLYEIIMIYRRIQCV